MNPDPNYNSSSDSDFDDDPYPFEGEFDRTHRLRGRNVVSSGRLPSYVTQTRRATHYSYSAGTGTTHESREAAQQNVPSSVRNSWLTGSGESGSWGVDNPPPQRRGPSWASIGTAFGGAVGFAVSTSVGDVIEQAASSVFGPTTGRAARQIATPISTSVGALLGYGVGRMADYFTRPRYDAGHTRSNAIGGLGDNPDTVFGQNPQINRGNRLNGQPTFGLHRQHERDEVRAVRRSSSSLHTTTLSYGAKNK